MQSNFLKNENSFHKIEASSYNERKLLSLYSKANICENGCWEWTAAIDKNGYGITLYSKPKKNCRAHRLMYILLKGEIPSGILVCHKCDNPKCININHLFLGTCKDNSQDREKKKRGKTQNQHGEKNHMCTLTSDIVLAIRKDSQNGLRECQIVRKYGLRQGTISKILLNKRWKHLQEK